MPIKTFRLQLRFLFPLVLALVCAAYVALPLMDGLMLRWASRDVHARGVLVANAVSDSVARALADGDVRGLGAVFDRTLSDERLLAMGLCDLQGQLVFKTAQFPPLVSCAKAREQSAEIVAEVRGGRLQMGVHPVHADQGQVGELILVNDMSVLDRRSADTRHYLLLLLAGLGGVMGIITMAVAQISWRGWVKGAQAIVREGLFAPVGPTLPELAPVAAELRARLRDLEDEYRKAQSVEQAWDPERLRTLLKTQLRGDQVIVVSNREPYIHEKDGAGIVVRRPASGLVTAVEPVMRACSGTWIAHGSGSADRDVVDSSDRVDVPPGGKEYRLRRIWLSAEEEKGYYYGFANEGLWPLCHVAHVRPVFRESDWEMYRKVNERFAQAVVDEASCEDPVILVQDYHFALLPAMIRARLPKATIITFWHIPWPNPESFGICPWRKEIIEGLLGSTILGFHTRFHCKNFMETVDRLIECRIESEHNIISHGGELVQVQHYPISIRWPSADEVARWPSVQDDRDKVRQKLSVPSDRRILLGVDRFDYTKGILERLYAVERLLEKHPHWIGQVSFLQVAAPTRSELDEYKEFQGRIHRLTARINARFGREGGYMPVILLAQHHDADELVTLYRGCDVCVVTSLHDGMNLVSKEFVSCRDDEQGVLVLSSFAGAAKELTDALIVNPYHVEESADALDLALRMPVSEQRERMASLRMVVRENNIYKWAGRMLTDTATLRLRARIEARLRGGGRT
jgi:alpha,alpha-trehalose-phosphate synthase [UDP-forming]